MSTGCTLPDAIAYSVAPRDFACRRQVARERLRFARHVDDDVGTQLANHAAEHARRHPARGGSRTTAARAGPCSRPPGAQAGCSGVLHARPHEPAPRSPDLVQLLAAAVRPRLRPGAPRRRRPDARAAPAAGRTAPRPAYRSSTSSSRPGSRRARGARGSRRPRRWSGRRPSARRERRRPQSPRAASSGRGPSGSPARTATSLALRARSRAARRGPWRSPRGARQVSARADRAHRSRRASPASHSSRGPTAPRHDAAARGAVCSRAGHPSRSQASRTARRPGCPPRRVPGTRPPAPRPGHPARSGRRRARRPRFHGPQTKCTLSRNAHGVGASSSAWPSGVQHGRHRGASPGRAPRRRRACTLVRLRRRCSAYARCCQLQPPQTVA